MHFRTICVSFIQGGLVKIRMQVNLHGRIQLVAQPQGLIQIIFI
jgi:hypothetical protein